MMEALPPGWETGWAPQYGARYYCNTVLGITQWDMPKPLAKPSATNSLVSADYEDVDDSTTEARGAMSFEDRDPQWAASVALAHKLAHKLGQAQGTSKRRKQTGHLSQAEDLRRHLYEPAAAAAAAAPAPVARAPGLSYAMAAGHAATIQGATMGDDSNTARRSQTARSAAPRCSHPNSRSSSSSLPPSQAAKRQTGGPGVPDHTLRLLIDGANVAFKYGEANGRPGRFCARGIALAVEYARAHLQLADDAIGVILNENRWDAADADLAGLEERGLVSWTPTAKDDDVFLLTAAADQEAWVLTNDRWTDHRAARHATAAVKARTMRFGWIREVFAPAADDVGRYSRADGARRGV